MEIETFYCEKWIYKWAREECYLRIVYMSYDGHVYFTDWKFELEPPVFKSNSDVGNSFGEWKFFEY